MLVTAPEHDAAEALARTWRPLDAAGALPVDPVVVARRLGIDVRGARLPRGTYVLLVGKPGRDPLLYIDRYAARTRQLFAVAHGVGHYVHRVAAGDLEFRLSDTAHDMSTAATDPDEVYANDFAAALLMPEDAVRRELAATTNPALLAPRFRVSAEVMVARLHALGIR